MLRRGRARLLLASTAALALLLSRAIDGRRRQLQDVSFRGGVGALGNDCR
ncbi:MAG TPA: hypothetical protein VL131_00780 [Gammaproteobacteria bacterium]|nr:hypothetical protein [Gammaproteobacteria bacterium]